MFKLIWLLVCLPFYIIYISIEISVYVFIFIIEIISSIIKCFLPEEKNPKQYKKVNIKSKINKINRKKLNVLKDYNDEYKYSDEYNCNVDNYYEKLHYYDKPKNIESATQKKKYILSQITDTEIKVTIEKIQELYSELGFKVKVIDIVKKKYITEYEVIFSSNITQYDILSVSDKIIREFQIDGVKIVRNSKKENRIYVQIPLKYEETLT